METREKLSEDLKSSLKSGDKLRLSTIRLLLSEIRNAEIAKRGELDTDEMLTVITREAKRRRESITEFKKGGRQDLVEKEEKELEILKEYLPEQLAEGEIKRMIDETIKEMGASSPGDLGKVMGKLMQELKGRADGKQVNKLVREALQDM